jgi:hypothetical protein
MIEHMFGSMARLLVESRALDLATMPDARAEEEFAELHRVREMVEAEYLRRLADLDRRGAYRRDGHLSTIAWLIAAFAMAGGVARELVRLARALREMPETRRAFEDGEISLSSVRALAQAREAAEAVFGSSEDVLVEAARRHSVRDLGKALAYWRQAVQRSAVVADEEVVSEQRYLNVSPTAWGMVRVDGLLDPESGEAIMAAVAAEVDADTRSSSPEPDDRTPGQRRCDALGAVARGWLDLSTRRSVAGERPHITVTVALDALRKGVGPCEAERVTIFPIETARRLACDASIIPAVLGGSSEPLDIGRRTAVVPPSVRRAVVLRDGGCAFPGCERPPPWCDCHHAIHWANGGPTSLANLVMLCRRHHRLVHSGFGLAMIRGRPEFRRPDGSILQERTWTLAS